MYRGDRITCAIDPEQTDNRPYHTVRRSHARYARSSGKRPP